MMTTQSKTVITIVVIILGITVFKIAGFFQPIESAVRQGLLPVARFMALIGNNLSSVFVGRPEVKHLVERNRELEARFSSIVTDYVRLRALEEENRALNALVKFQADSGYDYVPARIIGRSTNPRRASILIDRGSKDGVETGMAVVVGEGIYVGKVTGLKERVSIVTVVTDERSRVAAASPGRGELLGLVEGRGNNVARLDLVPQSAGLKPNDIVVTAGTEDKIPANLTIGIINAVTGQPTDPFKQASLESLAKVDRLDQVLVLRPTALRPDN